MEMPGKLFVAKRVVIYEFFSFIFIILIIWLDEMLDMPSMFLGGEPTPVNWIEASFETVIISIFGIVIIYLTAKLFQEMKYLEGILPLCSSCKKIRDDKGNWSQIEVYVRERTEAEFSHGICPECAEKLYPEFNPYKKCLLQNDERYYLKTIFL